MSITIRTKFLIVFASLFFIFAFIGAVSLFNRSALYDALGRIEGEGKALEAVERAIVAVDAVIMPANDLLITGDPGERTAYAAARIESDAAMAALEGMEPFRSSPAAYAELTAAYGRVKLLSERIMALKNPVGSAEGARLMKRMDIEAAALTSRRLKTVLESRRADFERERARTASVKATVDLVLLASAAVALLTAFALYLYLVRSILGPVTELGKGASALGAGRFEHRIDIRDGMEMNMLADTFNKMADSLEGLYKGLEDKVAERTEDLQKLNMYLRELSITDGLTGAFNHRHFQARLDEEAARASRYGHPLSLLMLDLDRFKEFNDARGHAEGDRALKWAAAAVRGSVRALDVVARYGGEEFAVIMPETGKKEAALAAERIRRKIEEGSAEIAPGVLITVSIGVAALVDDAADRDGLIKAADGALYKAKENGRNRVETA